jgi:hypothetical protein
MNLITRMYLLPKARECGTPTTLLHTPAIGGAEDNRSQDHLCSFNSLTPELNPSAQHCLPKFFTADFNF